jgi:hypothetical protein
MTIYPSLNATVVAAKGSTAGLHFGEMTIEDAVSGLKKLVKAKKFDGVRNTHIAYLAFVANELANQSIIHKATAALDSIVDLTARYDAIDESDMDKFDEIDEEIANSYFQIEYKASKEINPELNEDIESYPDQYRIKLTESDDSTLIRISGKVGWSDQCFPETAALEFKLLESPNWSTYPATEPEKIAVLEYAHFLINHA